MELRFGFRHKFRVLPPGMLLVAVVFPEEYVRSRAFQKPDALNTAGDVQHVKYPKRFSKAPMHNGKRSTLGRGSSSRFPRCAACSFVAATFCSGRLLSSPPKKTSFPEASGSALR